MDRLQVFEERSCWIKRGLLNKLLYTFNGYFLVSDHKDVRVIKLFLGVPNLRRSTPFYIFMHFLPGISLLPLWRFVAEVRWLFPESRQKKRESGKQRILNHGGESWTRTQRFLKSVLRAHHFIENILSKSSAVPVYCLFVFACLFFLLWQFFVSFFLCL